MAAAPFVLRAGNDVGVRKGRQRVPMAKRALGPRGLVWWSDGAPSLPLGHRYRATIEPGCSRRYRTRQPDVARA